MKTIVCCFICLTLLVESGMARAHQDRIMAIASGGTLVGLPAEFGVTKLIVEFGNVANQPPIKSVTLEIDNRQTKLPTCLTRLLPARSVADIKSYASWYHEGAASSNPSDRPPWALPPYIGFDFVEPSAKRVKARFKRYSFLFDLTTNDLLMFNVAAIRKGGQQRQGQPVDVTAICTGDDLKSVRWRPILP